MSRKVPDAAAADASATRAGAASAGSLSSPGAAPTSAPGPGAPALPLPSARCGPYELLAELGRGGMGVVHRARHTALGKTVAVKVIQVGPGAPDDYVQRFHREAELAASLHHPGIVGVHDVGAEGDLHWLAMDFVDGRTLERWIESDPPLDALLRALEEVCRAVHHAHEHGIIHRDLKPSNVMIDAAGRPHVTDFGLAKRLSGGPGANLTVTGSVLGTPYYMAPEQATGCTRLVGPRADVYSLGALIYHAVTGRPPFQGGGVTEVLLRIVQEEPAAPRAVKPSLPRAIDALLGTAMARLPEDRYATAADLAEELRRLREGTPLVAQPTSRRLRWERWLRHSWSTRRRAWQVAGAAVALGCAIGIAIAAYPPNGPGPDRSTSRPTEPPASAPESAPVPDLPAEEPLPILGRLALDDPSRATADLARLERALEDLAPCTGEELRLLHGKLRDTATRGGDPALRRRLERLAESVREEQVRRVARVRDETVRRAAELRDHGDLRAALEALQGFRRDYPAMADHPVLREAIVAATAAANTAVRGIESELAALEGAELPADRASLESRLDRLPAAEAERVRARLAAIDEERTRRERDRVEAEERARSEAAAQEESRWNDVLGTFEGAIQARRFGDARDALRAALEAGGWTDREPMLRDVETAVGRVAGMENAAKAVLAAPPAEPLELTFLEPTRAGGGSLTFRARVLGLEEAANGGVVVRLEMKPGQPPSQKSFHDLAPASIAALARRVPGEGAPLDEADVLLFRGLREGDLRALRTLIDGGAASAGVARFLEERILGGVRWLVGELAGAVERKDAGTCAWMVAEIDALRAQGLTPEELGQVARARRMAETGE